MCTIYFQSFIASLKNIDFKSVLAFLGTLAVLFSVIKVLFPEIEFKIVSAYLTLDINKKCIVVLKLRTVSNVDLTIEDITADAIYENDDKIKMIPYSVRWKAVLPKMLDLNRQECDYKLTKALEPDLRICGIKQGTNECYITMRSEEVFDDKPIKSWSFVLKYRQHLLPFPNLPWFNTKTIKVPYPEGKDLYIDDSLFQKISPEERQKIIDEL